MPVCIKDLPKETLLQIVHHLEDDPRSLLYLSSVDKSFAKLLNGAFWLRFYQQHFAGTDVEVLTPGARTGRYGFKKPAWPSTPTKSARARLAVAKCISQLCDGCGALGVWRRPHSLEDAKICYDCSQDDRWKLVTKTRAKEAFHLTDDDLDGLPYREVENPHYKSGFPMHLYPLHRVKKISERKARDKAQKAARRVSKREAAQAARRQRLQAQLAKEGIDMDKDLDQADYEEYIHSGRPNVGKVVARLLDLVDGRDE